MGRAAAPLIRISGYVLPAGTTKKPSVVALPVGRTMKAAHRAAQCIPNTEIVKAGALVEASFARGLSPSAAARKTLALMIQAAAGDGWNSGPHSMLRRELRVGHQGNERLSAIMDELQRTLLRIGVTAPGGAAAVMVAPVIAYRIEPRAEDEGARVWWEFSEPARRAMQDSDHFAAMNRAALLAFESRYAVTLYERGCLLAGRRDPRWRGTVDEFRSLLGIPAGAYRTWGNIRQKVVDPATAEVNLLADFVVSCRIENGPHNKTVAVELWFLPKPPAARDAAAAEIKRPRVGRKARRQDAPPALRLPADLGWGDHVTGTSHPRKARKPS
jgi:hypothetical protein